MPEAGQSTGDVRDLGAGEAISGSVVRDLLLGCLRHDALADAALERLDALAREGRDDYGTTAKMVRDLVGDLMGVVVFQDWIQVGAALKDAHGDASGSRAAAGASAPGSGEGGVEA